jgi:hypothetical protein
MLECEFVWTILLQYLGAIEVAVLRAVCTTMQNVVDEEDEGSFDFTISPILPLLSKFTRGEHLLWVVCRLGESLIQPTILASHRLPRPGRPWRHLGMQGRLRPNMIGRHRQLERLVHAFWFHPSVQALLTTAIRLDCCSLVRRLSMEAPSSDCPAGEEEEKDGPDNFLYNCWVFIEESQMKVDLWQPLRLDPTFPAGEHFFSKIHYMLSTFMEAIRRVYERDFRGYCPEEAYPMELPR